MLTLDACRRHIEHTVGGPVSDLLDPLLVINNAGEFLATMHPWKWLETASVDVPLIKDRDYVDLSHLSPPFRELRGYSKKQGFTGGITLTTHDALIRMRSGTGSLSGQHYGAISQMYAESTGYSDGFDSLEAPISVASWTIGGSATTENNERNGPNGLKYASTLQSNRVYNTASFHNQSEVAYDQTIKRPAEGDTFTFSISILKSDVIPGQAWPESGSGVAGEIHDNGYDNHASGGGAGSTDATGASPNGSVGNEVPDDVGPEIKVQLYATGQANAHEELLFSLDLDNYTPTLQSSKTRSATAYTSSSIEVHDQGTWIRVAATIKFNGAGVGSSRLTASGLDADPTKLQVTIYPNRRKKARVIVADPHWRMNDMWPFAKGDNAEPQIRLEIYPTPSSTTTEALTLYYRAGWARVYDDRKAIQIPAYVEPLYIELLRAFARGYEEEDQASLSERISEVWRGPLFAVSVDRDASVQPDYGPLRNGAAASMHRGAQNWDFNTIQAPS